jgi:hypothetical protein
MVMREKPINPLYLCPACKEYSKVGHYVPPSLGEEGFYICDLLNPQEQAEGIEKRIKYEVPKKEISEQPQIPGDEGPLAMTIGLSPNKDVLAINFGKPITWFGLNKKDCLELGKLLVTKATMEMVD